MIARATRHPEPPRLAVCICGWVATAPTLAGINAAYTRHVRRDPCGGCEHAWTVAILHEERTAR